MAKKNAEVAVPDPVPIECLEMTGKVLKDSGKEVFGPVLWHLLHKQSFRSLSPEWLDAFEAAIPCQFCRGHFVELRKKVPIEAFVTHDGWAWAIHNLVNAQIGRPVMSLEEARYVHEKK